MLFRSRAFFKSVENIINTLSPFEKHRLKVLTHFDVGALYIINKQYVKGILYCMLVLTSPVALWMSIRKVIIKRQSEKLAEVYSAKGLYPYRTL